MFIEPSEVLTIVKPTYSPYTAVILTTVDDTQHTSGAYVQCRTYNIRWWVRGDWMDQVNSEQVNSDQVNCEQVTSEQVNSDQVNSEQVRFR